MNEANKALDEAALEFRLSIFRTMLESMRQVEKFFHEAGDELEQSINKAQAHLDAFQSNG